ncbi:MAG: long-chain fatty acid--CoA ligase [Pseudobutyrivibrio sp.]|nr:long-chain fatty acid--CoA ligase [Pseudobutyrivibrio sp.]
MNNTSIILLSSGTTNLPKAIMLSEENVVSNIIAISDYLKLTHEDNILLIKELSHSSSIIGELFVGLTNTCKIVLGENIPIAKYILPIIKKERISVFFAVPSILKDFIMTYYNEIFSNSSLRLINFYGAPMNATDINKLMDIFPNTNLIYSYGQTEASPRVTYIEKDDIKRKKGSSGRPINDVQVFIMRDNNMMCKIGEIGEIVVEGPNVMQGYYLNRKNTEKTIVNGKLYTGDYGYLDEDGFLFVTGRKDNLLISSGKNIYPEEIERVLLELPGINEVLVASNDKGDATSELVAYVVTKHDYKIKLSYIFEHCKKNLEAYKIPKDIYFTNELLKTGSGKIIRNQKPMIIKPEL